MEPQDTSAPAVGSIEWLKARVAEHKAAIEQAKAQLHAHDGAAQAYQRLLDEMPVDEPPGG